MLHLCTAVMPKRVRNSSAEVTKRRRFNSRRNSGEEEVTGRRTSQRNNLSQSQRRSSQPQYGDNNGDDEIHVRPPRRRNRQNTRSSQRPSQQFDEDFEVEKEEDEEQEIQPANPRPTSRQTRRQMRNTPREPEQLEGEDDDVDDIQPAPRLRSNRANRQSVRQMGSQRVEENGVEEEQSEDEDVIVPVRQHSRGRSQEHLREQEYQHDGGDDDEDDEDDDDDDGPVQFAGNNEFSCSGILQSVRMDRFMSHDCFRYDLGPNVNIVNGANGSGKSAIVAALQLGLGAKASQTERGSKVDDHIKHNETSAVITIQILNRKQPNAFDMTFKHDVYGDVITIERRMNRGRNGKSGSSTWVVKGKKRNGKLPESQTARREVMDIVDHFGFMVNNPVAILTQTKSKAFLAKGKPVQHYELYREATLLKPLEVELMQTIEVFDDVKRLIKHAVEKQPIVVKQLEKLDLAYREAKEMSTINDRILQATIRLAWTEYQEVEFDVAHKEKRTADEFQPRVDKAQAIYDELNKKLDLYTSRQAELSELAEEATNKTKIAREAYRKEKAEEEKERFSIKRFTRKCEEAEAEITDVQKSWNHIQTRKSKARSDHFKGQEQKSRLVEEVASLNTEQERLKEEVDKAREEEGSYMDERLSVQDEVRKFQDEDRRLEGLREGKMREHAQLSRVAQNNDQMARFGHYVPELMRKIQRLENKFKVLPIGPVGQYVKLEDETWAATIEQAIGRTLLMSFIVADSKDQRLLQSLLPRRGPRPNILVMNMQRGRYDINSDTVPDVQQFGHSTVLDMLSINQDIVFNALVDLSQIEQTVLNERDADITQLAWSHTPNVGTVWSKNGERAYSRNGSKTFRKAPRRFGAVFLTKDMAPRLQSLRDEVLALEQELLENKQRLTECERNNRGMNQKMESTKRRIQQMTRESNDIHRKTTEIEDKLNRAENAFDPTPFDRELDELESRKQALVQDKNAAQQQIGAAEQKLQDIKMRLESCRREAQEVLADNKKRGVELEEAANEVAKVKSKLRSVKREYEAAKSDLDSCHRLLEQRRQVMGSLYTTASEAGPCPEDLDCRKQGSEAASRHVNMLKKRLRTEQNRRGGKTAEQIEKEFLMAKSQHDQNRRKLERVEGYSASLTKGIKQRGHNLNRLEKSLKKLVRFNFRRFLGTRGHTGNIRFGVDEAGRKELLISTQMASHKRADGERYETVDLRSLSGGERSFTTLCFMMALAEICQNPIRVMDEIDVFQDEANRRASFKILVDFFKNYLPERQVVIITPHSLPNIQSSPAVRIVKLDAPKRRDVSDARQQTQIDSFM